MAISDFEFVSDSRVRASRVLATFRDAFDIGEKGRIQSLDGLRAIAVVLVFNTHFFGYFYNRAYFDETSPILASFVRFLRNGDIGVDLFFVISGYLMFVILSRGKEDSAVYFFSRRALRLLPAQWVILTFLAVGAPFFPLNFVANALFVSPIFPGAENMNPVTWSLTSELIFYVIIFFVFRMARLAGLSEHRLLIVIATAAALIVGSFVLRMVASSGLTGDYSSEMARRIAGFMSLGRMSGFILGMIIPLIASRRKMPSPIVFAAGAVLIALMSFRTADGDEFMKLPLNGGYYIASSIAFGVIVLACIQGVLPGQSALRWLPVQIIGKISYSFYLIHYPLCESVHLFFPNITTGTGLAAAYISLFALTVLLSGLLYIHVEKRYFNMWRRPVSQAA